MNKAQLLVAEQIRVETETAIRKILSDFYSDDIRLDLTIHSTKDETLSLYNIAVARGWEGHSSGGTEWACSSEESSNTTVFA